jgi:hypothetical protein
MDESVPSEQDVLDRIRLEMARHLRENEAPEDVHDFLVRHWARLMTRIFMAKGNQDADWNAGWDTVNALLWSLSPKHGREETEKMLRMLPAILARLNEGCSALAIARGERDALFERLAMMHAAVARAGLKYPAGPEDPITGLSAMATIEETTSDIGRLVPPDPPVHVVRAQGHQADRAGLPQLKMGDRLHFTMAGEDRVLRVSWVSPVGGMYLFTNEQGLDALTLTRARLAERFEAGTASLV